MGKQRLVKLLAQVGVRPAEGLLLVRFEGPLSSAQGLLLLAYLAEGLPLARSAEGLLLACSAEALLVSAWAQLLVHSEETLLQVSLLDWGPERPVARQLSAVQLARVAPEISALAEGAGEQR
mmetsp:Transcript_1581/g.4066  ORF Transcript_1581/g.4066 Transcript_1581/m.4066 type:complete len:122 (-) Transcript_1581:1585-1950(-)